MCTPYYEGTVILVALSIVAFLVAAKAHGRQLRLEREFAGCAHVTFGAQNPPFVEALWRRERRLFWGVSLGTGLSSLALRLLLKSEGPGDAVLLREKAQRHLSAVREAVKEPEKNVPHLSELVGALWLRSLAIKNAGAEPAQLQIDLTRGKALDDNRFAAELQLIEESSFNIHREGEVDGEREERPALRGRLRQASVSRSCTYAASSNAFSGSTAPLSTVVHWLTSAVQSPPFCRQLSDFSSAATRLRSRSTAACRLSSE